MGRNREKAGLAMEAMKALGFTTKQVRPVLKRLFKLFDENWAPIEDESYRALADAVLDSISTSNSQQQQQQANANEGQGEELDARILDDHHHHQQQEDEEPHLDPDSNPTGPHYATSTCTLQTPPAAAPTLLTQHLHLKHPKPEPDPEPVGTDASHCFNAQSDLIPRLRKRNTLPPPPPHQNPTQISGDKNRAIQHHTSALSVEPVSSTMNNAAGSQLANLQEAPSSDTIHVASSPGGEVTMSLKCTAADPSKFRMPSLQAVLKMVEDKCLSCNKLLPPDLSIGSLMTEVCQCVAQLGTQHALDHNTQSKIILGNGSTSKSLDLEAASASSNPAHQQHLPLSISRTTHDVEDISRGAENVRIPIANVSGRVKCPPSFYYIPSNMVYQNALVSMSFAKIGHEDCCSDCFGDCLSALVPCPCARETGGEYAYTPAGLVKPEFIDKFVSMNRFPEEHHRVFCKTCLLERSRDKASPEPCRGHLARKFIKECWSKCGCNMQCGNRVVQRGIRCSLEVFYTGDGRGWGLRAQDALPKGAFVCEYAGEILTSSEVHERAIENMQNARYTHAVVLDAGWCSGGVLKDEDALCLDGTFYGNVGRFINHRCRDANLAMVPVEVETPDRQYYHVAFFTSRKVEALEELTWDYGIDFEDSERQPVKAFECVCGSRYCRGSRRHRQHLRNGKRNRAD